jgi:uncharacterized membrane protein
MKTSDAYCSCFVAYGLFGVAALAVAPASAQTFTTLGFNFTPAGMSGDSTRVVGTGPGTLAGGGGVQTGLVWSAGSFSSLDYLPDQSNSGGVGISHDGTLVVGSSSTSLFGDTFTEVPGSGSPSILPRPSPNYTGMLGAGISGNGSVVASNLVDFFGNYPSYAVSTSGGVSSILSPLAGGSFSNATRVTTNGVILGQSNDGDGQSQAVKWVGGAPASLGLLFAGRPTTAYAGTPSAELVAGTSINAAGTGYVGFLWAGGVMTELDPVGISPSSEARAITDDGLLIGGYSFGGVPGHVATLWDDAGTATSLTEILNANGLFPGWDSYQDIIAVNSHDGVFDILGTGRLGGSANSFLVTDLTIAVVPEPAQASALLGAAALLCVGWRRRRRRA